MIFVEHHQLPNPGCRRRSVHVQVHHRVQQLHGDLGAACGILEFLVPRNLGKGSNFGRFCFFSNWIVHPPISSIHIYIYITFVCLSWWYGISSDWLAHEDTSSATRNERQRRDGRCCEINDGDLEHSNCTGEATPGRALDLQRRGIWSRSFQCVASTSSWSSWRPTITKLQDRLRCFNCKWGSCRNSDIALWIHGHPAARELATRHVPSTSERSAPWLAGPGRIPRWPSRAWKAARPRPELGPSPTQVYGRHGVSHAHVSLTRGFEMKWTWVNYI